MFASLSDSLFFYETHLGQKCFDVSARKPAVYRSANVDTLAAAGAADKRSPHASDPLRSLGPFRYVMAAFLCGVLLLGRIPPVAD